MKSNELMKGGGGEGQKLGHIMVIIHLVSHGQCQRVCYVFGG